MIEVYYIEDDETIADLVKEYLAQQNCSVLIFRTISDAQHALLKRLPTLKIGQFTDYLFDCSRGFSRHCGRISEWCR